MSVQENGTQGAVSWFLVFEICSQGTPRSDNFLWFWEENRLHARKFKATILSSLNIADLKMLIISTCFKKMLISILTLRIPVGEPSDWTPLSFLNSIPCTTTKRDVSRVQQIPQRETLSGTSHVLNPMNSKTVFCSIGSILNHRLKYSLIPGIWFKLAQTWDCLLKITNLLGSRVSHFWDMATCLPRQTVLKFATCSCGPQRTLRIIEIRWRIQSMTMPQPST
jgi:hypothetical protein